ncbi:hypothetical protein ACU4GD_23180 [Cupriavidus basilensis]
MDHELLLAERSRTAAALASARAAEAAARAELRARFSGAWRARWPACGGSPAGLAGRFRRHAAHPLCGGQPRVPPCSVRGDAGAAAGPAHLT